MRKTWGCAVAAGILILLLLALVVIPNRRAASRAREGFEAVRPGMTLHEVFGAVDGWTWASATGDADLQVTSHEGSYSALWRGADRRCDSRQQLLELVDGQDVRAAVRRITFTYKAAITPAKVSFVVNVGKDGKVESVSQPVSWD